MACLEAAWDTESQIASPNFKSLGLAPSKCIDGHYAGPFSRWLHCVCKLVRRSCLAGSWCAVQDWIGCWQIRPLRLPKPLPTAPPAPVKRLWHGGTDLLPVSDETSVSGSVALPPPFKGLLWPQSWKGAWWSDQARRRDKLARHFPPLLLLLPIHNYLLLLRSSRFFVNSIYEIIMKHKPEDCALDGRYQVLHVHCCHVIAWTSINTDKLKITWWRGFTRMK